MSGLQRYSDIPINMCPWIGAILASDAQMVLQFGALEMGTSQPYLAFHSPACRALSENFSMNKSLVAALAVAVAAALAPGFADAKRLGAGKSSGTQRNMPERTAPTATPATPAAPAAAAAKPATPAAAAAPATPPKRNWMGPLAGLAAGLGLAALMSHLGMGAGFANFILIALLAVAAFAAFAYFRRRSQAAKDGMTPALAGAGAGAAGAAGAGTQVAWPSQAANPVQERTALDAPAAGSFEPASAGAGAGVGTFALPGKAPVTAAFVPAAFDSDGFARIAKAIFIRMQAANDTANLDDLRQFTTPEMFAEVKLELMERGNAKQSTDVQRVDAKVLDVAEEGTQLVVSVRYTGEAVEVAGQAATPFDEVWHMIKPAGDSGAWLIAGIEQMA
jgi:predicted lipid-binding transport protein (Tim44 family)